MNISPTFNRYILTICLHLALFLFLQGSVEAALPVIYPSAAKTMVASLPKAEEYVQVEIPDQQSLQENLPLGSVDEIIAEFTAADTVVQQPEVLNVYYDLFKAAYEVAPDIQVARKRQVQKNEELNTAWSRRISPKVNASVSQVREFNNPDNDIETDEPDTYQYQDGEEYADWGLDFNVPLYRRSLGVQLNLAKAEQQIADNDLKIKTQELDIGLKNILADYILSSYRLVNINNSIELSTKHVERIYRGYQLRDQTRLQLLRAEANLKELEARRDLDEHDKEKAFRDLLDFTGLPETNPVFKRLNSLLTDEVAIAGCINSLADVNAKYETLEAFINGMDSGERQFFFKDNSLLYSQIVLEKLLAEQQAATFTQNEYPDLAIRGFYDRNEDTQFTKFNGEGSLSLVLSIPLFTGGTIFSTTKTAAMARHIADINQYTDLRERIHNIENNKKLIASLRGVYEKQQINLRQQEEIVVLSVKSYQIKQTSMQDLLTSQNSLIDAKNDLMQTTNRLAALYRQFAFELGAPFPLPELAETQ